jgi:glutaredoxin 2
MIFGYKNLDFQLEHLLNDDEDTPVKMIGQKMLPILQKEDGSYIGDSLDIIEFVDINYGEQPFVDAGIDEDERLKDWLSKSREFVYQLAMPRWIKIGLEEFKTQGAIDYFTKKKEDYIGSFNEHMKNTEALVRQADEHLRKLDEMLNDEQKYFSGKASINDIQLYPTLRSLSVCKDVTFPTKVLDYMEEQEELTKVPLHLDIAI